MSFPDDLLDLTFEAFLLGEWVDLSDRLLGDQQITDTQGRADESSTTSAGSCTVLLDNRDGHLTPVDPRSPWWPDWDRNVQVRLKAEGNILAVQQAASIVPTWPVGDISDDTDPGECFVNVDCAGILRRLNQRSKPLRSPLVRLATNPTNLPHLLGYWPLEDGTDAKSGASALPSRAGDVPSTMGFVGLSMGSDDGLGGSEALPTVSSGQAGSWYVTCKGSTGHWAIEQVVHLPAAPNDISESVTWDVFTGSSSHARWSIAVGFDGTHSYIRVASLDSTGAFAVDEATFSPSGLFGVPFVTLRLEVQDDGSNIDWDLTWAQITVGTDVVNGLSGTIAGEADSPRLLRGGTVKAPPGGVSFGHVMSHDGIAAGWLVPADSGWVGETASDRMSRLCGEEGIGIAFVFPDPSTGITTSMQMGPQRAISFIDLLGECAETDGGLLCEARTGLNLRYWTRAARYNQDASVTLDASLNEIVPPFTPVRDDQQIRNDITMERSGGSKARQFDEASIDKNGLYDEQVTINPQADSILIHAAGWRLHLGTFEGRRFPQVTIDLGTRPDLIAWWATMRVGMRLRIINVAPQLFSWPVIDLIVEGWSDAKTPTTWTVTLNCSPATPWDVAVWGTDRYDSPGSTLNSSCTSTATSISVANTGATGAAWSHADGNFDILVDGEVMTVTAISGSSSPQTFTVVRSVNGIVRAHASGVAVGLAQPAILAL